VVQALVLLGGTPGIEDDAARAERRAADRRLAATIRTDGVDAFVERWLAMPMFAGLPPEGRFEHERRSNTAQGLAASLELAGTGSQAPLWHALGGIDVPVLVVAGEDDHRYAALAERTAAAVGANARAALVPDAGHSAHLEQPQRFVDLLLDWLSDSAGATGVVD
jgi:pimeloyl-ACP methyl ester carboxylesterase